MESRQQPSAENPSNFNVTLAAYSINDKTTQLDDCVIVPGGRASFKLSAKTPANFKLIWASMDDYGTVVKTEADISNK